MLRIYSKNTLHLRPSLLPIPIFRASSVEVSPSSSHRYLHIGARPSTAQLAISQQSLRLARNSALSKDIVSFSRNFHATRRNEGWPILLAALKVRRGTRRHFLSSTDAADVVFSRFQQHTNHHSRSTNAGSHGITSQACWAQVAAQVRSTPK